MSYRPGVCNFCGTGCGHWLDVKDGRIRGVYASPEHPVGRGRLCVRGWHLHELLSSEERIAHPLIRRNGRLEAAGWSEALDFAAARLSAFPGAGVGFLASPRSSNESVYSLVRLARSVVGSPNIDLLSAAGHRASVDVLLEGAGWPAMPASLADIRGADFIFILGTDLTRQNPIIASDIHFAARAGADVVVLAPRRTQMARLAGAHLWCRPGSERRVLAALARLVIEERGEAAERTAGDIKGYNGFAGALASVDLAKIESSTGVPLEQLRNAAVRLAKASRALAFFSSGVTGPDRGSVAYLFNLFLAAGKIGRKGCGVNPLAGICNIVGATDMGAAPDMLPGYLRVPNEPAAARFRAVWGAEIEAGPGTSPLDLLRKRDPGLKALLVADHDEEINLDSDRLRELDFTAYVGSYANPFLEYAHVVFPSATHAEADGTYTNTERRIQLNLRKTEPRFESRPEWRIYADLAERLGKSWPYGSAADVMAEVGRAVPFYAAASHDRLARTPGGLQWPCDAARPDGAPDLGLDPNRRPRFVPVDPVREDAAPSESLPFLLSAGKSFYFWHQNNAMMKTSIPRREYNALLMLYPRGLVDVHPDDAARLGLRDGRPVRVASASASMEVAARVTADVRPGSVHVPYFVGPMIPAFLAPHAELFERAEDAALPVRIEKV